MDSPMIDQPQALILTNDHNQDQTATSEQCAYEPVLVDAKDQCAHESMLVDANNQSQYETITHEQRSDEANFTGDNAQTKCTAPNKAAQVFATTELMEMILLNAHHRPLRSTLQQVSHRLRDTIRGSPRLQRNLHYTPDWKRTTICPAPIRASMLNYIESVQDTAGNFLYDCEPEVTDRNFILRFARDAIAWACNKDRSANSTFRSMLVCQPPPVAVEIFCWTEGEDPSKLKNVKRRIENVNGIRVGELFDLVQASAPIGGNTRMRYTFRRQDGQVCTKPERKLEDEWLLELRAIARKNYQIV